MKQIEKATPPTTDEFGPAQLTGNKAAAETADKVKEALDAIPVDRDVLLLAERNDVLDHAIERFGNGEHWISGFLAMDKHGNTVRLNTIGQTVDEEGGKKLRERGDRFCLIGGIGAEVGPHSYDAVDQAVSAVAEVVGRDYYSKGKEMFNNAYGFRHGGVWQWNDSNDGGYTNVINALRRAKSEPLYK